MTTESQQLANPIIPETRQIEIVTKFKEYTDIANEWKEKAFSIVVTDETQLELIEEAKKAKQFLKAKRIELEKTRKKLKEQSLEEGRLIDSIAKSLTQIIEPAESHLEIQEKFIEIQQAKRRLELETERLERLKPYIQYIDLKSFDLKTMTEVAFETIFNGAMFAHEQNLKRQEEERLKQEEQLKKNEILKQRQDKLKGLWFFFYSTTDKHLTADTTEEEFQDLYTLLTERKDKYDLELKEKEEIAKKAEQDRKKALEESNKLKEKLKVTTQKLSETNKTLKETKTEITETKLSYDVLLKQNIAMKKTLEDLNKFIIPDKARELISWTLNYLKTF